MENKNNQWHPGFVAALQMEQWENREDFTAIIFMLWRKGKEYFEKYLFNIFMVICVFLLTGCDKGKSNNEVLVSVC
ncbi:MAG: hypothetical protein K2I10_03525 [Lachnospiraceae bacterium]|nr:hypothetical protein [Lachnospiraceae bacterium]